MLREKITLIASAGQCTSPRRLAKRTLDECPRVRLECLARSNSRGDVPKRCNRAYNSQRQSTKGNHVASDRYLTNSRKMGLPPVWDLLSGQLGTALRRRLGETTKPKMGRTSGISQHAGNCSKSIVQKGLSLGTSS